MALLEDMMKNTPALSSHAKEELRKSFRCTKKSKRMVGSSEYFTAFCIGRRGSTPCYTVYHGVDSSTGNT